MDKRPPIEIKYLDRGKRDTQTYVLNHIPMVSESFLHKNIAIYGKSGSGKTCIFLNILYILKDTLGMGILTCPNPADDKRGGTDTYERFFPRPAIHTKMSGEMIKAAIDRQKYFKTCIEMSYNYDLSYKIFKQKATSEDLGTLEGISIRADRAISEVKRRAQNDPNIYVEQEVQKIIDEKNLHIHLFLRRKIREMNILKNEDFVTRHFREDESERVRLCINGHYSDNPELGLFFDDCGVEFKETLKKLKSDGSTDIGVLFSAGRKYYLTSIWLWQDSNQVPADYRRNFRLTIFTNTESARHFFSNAKMPDKVKTAEMIGNTIFSEDFYMKHCKLVYDTDTDKFWYFRADQIHSAKVGTNDFWNLATACQSDIISLDDNKMFKQYIKKSNPYTQTDELAAIREKLESDKFTIEQSSDEKRVKKSNLNRVRF